MTSTGAPVEVQRGPGLLVRAVWFVFVGWWLTGIMSTIAWLFMITIIGLPVGIWLINRIPTFITLRPRTREIEALVGGRPHGRTWERDSLHQPPMAS